MTQVARDLGINYNVLARWKRQLEESGQPGTATSRWLEAENNQLKCDNDVLRQELVGGSVLF